MKQDYTMYIYKTDNRKKTGERLVSTTVWRDRDEAGMERECQELFGMYPAPMYRIMYCPKMITVKNLMTGKDIQIDHDTPRSCDPSSELYWSM
jgi:hypothetical protein